jgi:hypothetical protein
MGPRSDHQSVECGPQHHAEYFLPPSSALFSFHPLLPFLSGSSIQSTALLLSFTFFNFFSPLLLLLVVSSFLFYFSS